MMILGSRPEGDCDQGPQQNTMPIMLLNAPSGDYESRDINETTIGMLLSNPINAIARGQ